MPYCNPAGMVFSTMAAGLNPLYRESVTLTNVSLSMPFFVPSELRTMSPSFSTGVVPEPNQLRMDDERVMLQRLSSNFVILYFEELSVHAEGWNFQLPSTMTP